MTLFSVLTVDFTLGALLLLSAWEEGNLLSQLICGQKIFDVIYYHFNLYNNSATDTKYFTDNKEAGVQRG